MTALASINLFAQDIERLKQFYVNGLGLQEDNTRSVPPSFYLLKAGNCTITLQSIDTPGAEPGSAGSIEIGFAVEDVDAVRRQLVGLEYKVGEIQQMGWGTALEARDPEGHRLNIFRTQSDEQV